MCHSDQQSRQTLHNFSCLPVRLAVLPVSVAYLSRILTPLLALCLLGACQPPPTAADVETAPVTLCGDDGRLVTELFGALQVELDWHAGVLECEGMPRPEGRGARLRFAGPAMQGSAARSLAFILAMPDIKRGESDHELPTNVTLIEEGTGRFFATADTHSCWTDIERHERDDNIDEASYRISGILYCVAPLAELNGKASVTLTELRFAGRLDWEPGK